VALCFEHLEKPAFRFLVKGLHEGKALSSWSRL
jgi:hypothetical protein